MQDFATFLEKDIGDDPIEPRMRSQWEHIPGQDELNIGDVVRLDGGNSQGVGIVVIDTDDVGRLADKLGYHHDDNVWVIWSNEVGGSWHPSCLSIELDDHDVERLVVA